MSCYNIGDISGNENVGGIAGIADDITKCYNLGNITGSSNVGGCIGYTAYNSIISSNYNMGAISGTSYVGGIIGYKYGASINNCYYETGTANYGVGSGRSGNDTGCTPTTREEILSQIGAFEEYKDDIYEINQGLPILSWQTDNDKLDLINGDGAFVEDTEGINNGYPILAWQVESAE